MAVSARSLGELQQSVERAFARKRNLVYGESGGYQLENGSPFVSLAIRYPWLWENHSKLHIIEVIFNHCSNKSSLAVLYFYFDFNDAEKQRPESIIRSLIIQLSLQCISVPQAMESLYATCTNGLRQPAYDSLLATLHQMMGVFQETYLIIDALDESLDRDVLLANVKEITGWKDLNLHTLVTSRREKDIVDSMERLADHEKICIKSMLINDDIHAYVRSRLQIDPKLKRWLNQPKLQVEIEGMLMDKADDM